jgi:hypothetical protein
VPYLDSDLVPPAAMAGLVFVRVLPLWEADRVFGVPLCRHNGRPIILLDVYVIVHPAPPRPIVEAPRAERVWTSEEIQRAIAYRREMDERKKRQAEREAKKPKPLKSIFESPAELVQPPRAVKPHKRELTLIRLDDGTPRYLYDEESANAAQGRWEEQQRRQQAREAAPEPEESAPADAVCVNTNNLTELPECFYDSGLKQIRSSRTAVVTTTGALYKSLYSFEAHDRSAEETLALMAREHISLSLMPKSELGAQRVWHPNQRDIIAAEARRMEAADLQADMAHLARTKEAVMAERNRQAMMAGQRTSRQIAEEQLAFARRQADADRREREAYRKQQMEGGPRMDISDFDFGGAARDLDFFGRPKKKR